MYNMCTVFKTKIRKYVSMFLTSSILLSMLVTGQPVNAAATTANVTVNADINGNKVSQTLIGGFSEDLNLQVDGGFYAEKVFNRSFEFGPGDKAPNNTPLAGWTQVGRSGGTGQIVVENSNPLNAVNTHYVHMNISEAGGGVGLSNAGWYGISLKAGAAYNYTIFARKGPNFDSSLSVNLESEGGTIYGSAAISTLTEDWVKYTGSIISGADDNNARLAVLANGTGDVYLDFISLFPAETYKNRPNGLRRDVGEALEDMNMSFLRFPGGCIIHQHTYDYNWKDTIGPVEGRKEYFNTAWQNMNNKEHITNGFGMFDWLQFCEDAGIIAQPCLPVGVRCGGPALSPDDPRVSQLVQDTLDFVEFCNGDADTTYWGAKRAEMGHPEPFNLEYLGIGNEEKDSTDARANIKKIYNAVHEAYPELKLVVTGGIDLTLYDFNDSLGGAYSTDVHFYYPRNDRSWEDFLNSYNRNPSYPLVQVGEYGSNSRDHSIADAVDTMKDMAVFEKNGDITDSTCFTLLRRQVDFDNTDIFKTVYYYKDKMWADNLADINVNFKQSGDKELVVVAGKDYETGDLILKLINNSANDINASIALNGITNIQPDASVTYLKPTVPGDGNGKSSNYRREDQDGPGQSTPADGVRYGQGTTGVNGNQLNYTAEAYSASIIRVHGTILPAAGTIYEAENYNGGASLTNGRAKSAVKELMAASSNFWSKADLQGVNEYIQYNNINVAEAGTYNIKVGIKKSTSRAITQLSIDGVNQGLPFDQYASGDGYHEIDLGPQTLSGGMHSFRFTVTGKNPSSSGYMSGIDYIKLMGTGNFNTMTTGSEPLGWNLDTSAGSVTVQEVPSAGDKSVLMSKVDTTEGSKTSMYKEFDPLSGTVTIEAKVRRESAADLWCLPDIYSSDGSLAASVIFDNGDIKAYGDGAWQPVQEFIPGTWYTLKLVINTDIDKFDLYVDEVQKVTQAALRNAVDDIGKIEFYAADGNAGDTYVDIESEPASASNAALSGLVISQGTLSPAFAPGTVNYDAGNVVYNVSSMEITPTLTSPDKQSLTVNGVPAASGVPSRVSLAEGINSIPVVVKAEDGTTATYTIIITRAIFQSSDANLSSLATSEGTLFPAFNPVNKNYTVIVANSVSSIDITPTASSAAYQSLTVSGVPSASGTASSVNLAVGANSITVVVTAQDGTISTYKIDILRLVPEDSQNFNTMPTGSAPLGWNIDTSMGTVTVQEVPSAADKSVLLNKTGSATGPRTSMYKMFSPLSGKVTIEAKVMREAASNLWCLPYVYSSDGTTFAATIQFDNGSIKAYNGGWQTIQPFTAGTWYDLKLVIDTDTDKFDFYIDGIRKVTQGTLRNPVDDIAKIEFYAADINTGRTYVDIETEPYCEISDTALKGLSISQGTLSPAFTLNNKNYTALVANSVASIDITPAVRTSGYQSLTVNGVSAASGAASSINLEVGENSIPVVVTAQDGTTATYTIVITREAGLSNNATLSNLTISQGTLSPVFTSNNYNYTAMVANSVTSVDITPTAASPAYQGMTVNGTASVSGAVSTVNLDVGENNIPVAVTAQDGSTATYTISITRDADHSHDNFNIMPTGAAPLGWNADTSVGTVTVEEVPSAADKSVLLNKTGTATGSRTSLYKTFSPLSGIVVVEAKVRREAASNLWCLPYVYSSDGVTYAETIQFDNGSIKAYNGGWKTIQPFTAGTWYDLKLVINTDTDLFDFYIDGVKKVTQGTLRSPVSDIGKIEFYAADFNTGKTYVDVEKEPYAIGNATLSDLEINTGTLSPAFTPGNKNYTATVANNVTSIDITPTAAFPEYSSLTVNGVPAASGETKTVALAVGVNSIPVVVTEQDGTTGTYVINVTREAEVSGDATLGNLEINPGNLSPAFTPDNRNYSASVENSVSSIEVISTAASPVYGSLTVNGEPAVSGEGKSVALAVGVNNIAIAVTAQDGTTDTYIISVTRRAEQSGIDMLSNLEINPGTLSPAFTPDNKNYEAYVAHNISSMEITPTVAISDYTSLTVNDVPTVSGAAISVVLAAGVNNIPVVVTAQDGTSDTYVISVTREAVQSGDAALSNLIISQGALSPAFTPDNRNYTASVANSVSSISITPIVRSPGYSSLTVNGVSTVSGAAISVELAEGINDIPVAVTAQDGTVAEYRISVTREAAANVPVTEIIVTPSVIGNFRVGEAARQLTATVIPENAANTNVLWSTGNPSVAIVSASGVLTAVGPGTTTIRATSISNNSVFGQCTVTVLPADNSGGGSGGNGGGSNGGGSSNGSSGTDTPKTPDVPKTPDTPDTPDTPAPVSSNLTDTRGHWAESNINKLVALGAIKGYPDGSFKPDKKITRAEFIAILINALKLSGKSGKAFTDTANHWAKDYISTASAYGIIAGFDDDTFRPNDIITREQMMVMVVNAAKLTQVNDDEAAFTDKSDISPWASGAINAAKKNGIIGGYPDNSFKPLDNATRAEAVTVIVKTLEHVK